MKKAAKIDWFGICRRMFLLIFAMYIAIIIVTVLVDAFSAQSYSHLGVIYKSLSIIIIFTIISIPTIKALNTISNGIDTKIIPKNITWLDSTLFFIWIVVLISLSSAGSFFADFLNFDNPALQKLFAWNLGSTIPLAAFIFGFFAIIADLKVNLNKDGVKSSRNQDGVRPV